MSRLDAHMVLLAAILVCVLLLLFGVGVDTN